jgi:hypothetical protein
MQLKILDAAFSIVKLLPSEPVPAWAMGGGLISITRTAEELSIVCPSDCLPVDAEFKGAEHGWACIKVEGVLDFSLTGILASLANPLADNGISIFAISTFNTDYLLVRNRDIEKAKAVLERAGHTFCG